jgi:hypothetical protein
MIEPTAQFRQPIKRTHDLANLLHRTVHIPRTCLKLLADIRLAPLD